MTPHKIHRLTQEYFNILIDNSVKERDVKGVKRIDNDLIIAKESFLCSLPAELSFNI